jgi:transaldolase
MFKFFFDTADVDYIKNVLDKVDIDRKSILGITTNPNAMSKINCLTLQSWEGKVKQLCELVTDMRNGQWGGEVHIQLPYSRASADEAIRFADLISSWSDGITSVSMKISPSPEILNVVYALNDMVKTNVTGLSDAGTAYKCIGYGVDYVSIIPGRMEEVGINADKHLRFLHGCDADIITGSMRTVSGLARAIYFNTLPTIGTRVWDQIIDGNIDLSTLHVCNDIDPKVFCPQVDKTNLELSTSFFDQMDKLGEQVYKDFISI